MPKKQISGLKISYSSPTLIPSHMSPCHFHHSPPMIHLKIQSYIASCISCKLPSFPRFPPILLASVSSENLSSTSFILDSYSDVVEHNPQRKSSLTLIYVLRFSIKLTKSLVIVEYMEFSRPFESDSLGHRCIKMSLIMFTLVMSARFAALTRRKFPSLYPHPLIYS